MSGVAITPAGLDDARDVAAIYGHHVLRGLGTFEETPPPAAEIARRIAAVLGAGLPYLLARRGETLVGFAYAAPFRPRAAYRYTVEDSIYVAPDALGGGVGRVLLARLIEDCEGLGLRQMLAVIGDSANAASIALHRSLGFEPAGMGRAVGFKHGRWLDIVTMQRPLNDGDQSPPSAAGLRLGSGAQK